MYKIKIFNNNVLTKILIMIIINYIQIKIYNYKIMFLKNKLFNKNNPACNNNNNFPQFYNN